MRKYLLLTAIMVLPWQMISPKTAPKVDTSAEEYAVYSAVIGNRYGDEQYAGKPTRLVIVDTTSTDNVTGDQAKEDERNFGRMFPKLKEGISADYRTRNKEPLQLKDSLQIKQKYVLVTTEEIEKIFRGGSSWDEFYKRYPDSGGYIRMSRPGFNKAMNQAIIYFEHGCGDLCGAGSYLLLEKSGDRWKVINEHMVWIS